MAVSINNSNYIDPPISGDFCNKVPSSSIIIAPRPRCDKQSDHEGYHIGISKGGTIVEWDSYGWYSRVIAPSIGYRITHRYI